MSVTAKSLLSKLAGPALDLVFLMSCAGCGKEGKLLCQTCVPVLPQLKKPFCDLCASPGQSSPAVGAGSGNRHLRASAPRFYSRGL